MPDRGLPAEPTRADIIDSGLRQTFLQRDIDTIIDVGTGDPIVSRTDLDGVLPTLPADIARAGRRRRARVHVGRRSPARRASSSAAGSGGSGPAFYFVHDVRAIEDALGQLRIALIIGTIVLILVALLVARVIARGVLAPVEAASRAAERLEHGDLSARVPVTSDDEFGTWAERFNRMAESLAETIGRLEAAESQNRRFVADVAHELRTPLAALVAEASILREHLGSLPAGEPPRGRAAGRRRRTPALARRRPDGGLAVRRPRRADRPRADRRRRGWCGPSSPRACPRRRWTFPRRRSSSRPTRGGSSGSWPISSTTPASTRRARRSRSRWPPIDGELVIAVFDRGPGVPPDQLERIFERFYKADPSRHGGSSGLGLAIAAEHAALLGGYLTAANLVGGGLRIELRLPVT